MNEEEIQRAVQDLISTVNRRDFICEIKDVLKNEKILSLNDVVFLYRSYLTDCFQKFYDKKEKLEDDMATRWDEAVLKFRLEREKILSASELENSSSIGRDIDKVFVFLRIGLDMDTIFADTYSLQGDVLDHTIMPDLNPRITTYAGKYGYQLQDLSALYYKSLSSVSNFEELKASVTKKSRAGIKISPVYSCEEKVFKDEDSSQVLVSRKSYYHDRLPVNLTIKNYPNLKSESSCDKFVFHMNQKGELKCVTLDTFDEKSIEVTYAYKEFSYFKDIPEQVFSKFKIYARDLPDFLKRYIEDYAGVFEEVADQCREKDGMEERILNDEEVEHKIEKLQIADTVKKTIADNNLKIAKLMKDNQNLYELLGEKQKISKEVLCMMIADEKTGHWVIRPEFRDDLAYYDLSDISFDNVDVRKIDFRNTNIRGINFNPQTVYHKDLSGCYFDTTAEAGLNSTLFDYGTNFADVNLEGTTIKQPLTMYNDSIAEAYVNQYTDLPDELWSIRKKLLSETKSKSKRKIK